MEEHLAGKKCIVGSLYIPVINSLGHSYWALHKTKVHQIDPKLIGNKMEFTDKYIYTSFVACLRPNNLGTKP